MTQHDKARQSSEPCDCLTQAPCSGYVCLVLTSRVGVARGVHVLRERHADVTGLDSTRVHCTALHCMHCMHWTACLPDVCASLGRARGGGRQGLTRRATIHNDQQHHKAKACMSTRRGYIYVTGTIRSKQRLHWLLEDASHNAHTGTNTHGDTQEWYVCKVVGTCSMRHRWPESMRPLWLWRAGMWSGRSTPWCRHCPRLARRCHCHTWSAMPHSTRP